MEYSIGVIRSIKAKIQNLILDKRFSEILTGSAWALSARVISTGFAMTTSIIISRAYGAGVLGIVAVLNSFLMLTTIFSVLGTNTSILRLIPEHLVKYSPTSAFCVYRKTQYFVAGMSLVTGSILFFSSDFIAKTIFSKPHLQVYFAMGAIFIVFKSLMILNTQAVRGLRFVRLFAFMQMLPAFSKLIVLVPITLFFYHKDNPVYAMFASIAITALIGVWIMDRTFKYQSMPNDNVKPMTMKEILRISLPMLMTSTMTLIIGQTGIIILGIYRPESQVGYYSVAVNLATLTAFIASAINSMAAPKFSELYHSDKIKDLFYVAKKSTKLIFWTSLPILVGLILFGKILLSILFGPEFVASYLAMVILIFGQFVTSISGPNGFFMNMTGNENKLKKIMIIAAILNVTLCLMLIPSLGLYGAAIAAMIGTLFWNIVVLIYMKKEFGKTIVFFPFL
jgi:O-antigen/teichoic acid export membrane protein